MIISIAFFVFSFWLIWFSGRISSGNTEQDMKLSVAFILLGVLSLLIPYLYGSDWVSSYIGGPSWLKKGQCYNIISTTKVEDGSVVVVLNPIGKKGSVRDVMVKGTEIIRNGIHYWNGSNFVGIPGDPKHTTP